jgi:hypothetical protein
MTATLDNLASNSASLTFPVDAAAARGAFDDLLAAEVEQLKDRLRMTPAATAFLHARANGKTPPDGTVTAAFNQATARAKTFLANQIAAERQRLLGELAAKAAPAINRLAELARLDTVVADAGYQPLGTVADLTAWADAGRLPSAINANFAG